MTAQEIQTLAKLDRQIHKNTLQLRNLMEGRRLLLEHIKKNNPESWIKDVLKETVLYMNTVEIYV